MLASFGAWWHGAHLTPRAAQPAAERLKRRAGARKATGIIAAGS
jgi:hypothetical protein